MNFTNPLNLLWTLPIGGLIVLMYILKLKRKDVVVSSTFLWRQVIRDVQANAPFQKLRKNLLLLLQLIIAALIIFALSRPFVRATSVGGRNIVLLVDVSASMQSTDVGPSRLDAAQRKAHDLVDNLKPGDRVMVLAAGARPRAMTGFTEERPELHRAIDRLAPQDTPGNMRDALNLAADLVASRKEGNVGRIELISDGGFIPQDEQPTTNNQRPTTRNQNPATNNQRPATSPQPPVLAGLNLGSTQVAFHAVGKGQENVGIIALDFRRNLGRAKMVQLLVVTHNFGTKPQRFNQEIFADDNLVDAAEVTLNPGAEDTQTYELPEPDSPMKMRVRLDVKDALQADNQAALVLKPRKTLKTLVVGKENLFLENALNVDPSIDLSRTASFDEANAKKYDVVVFYESAPAKLPPGHYLFLHCASDQAPVKVGEEVENVAPADWEKNDPVLRYVDFGSDRFGKALKASPQKWGREIAVAESGSLVAVGEKPGTRSVFVGFSLSESLFPLRVAFPILMANAVRWLGTGSEASERGQVPTGNPVAIPAPPGVSKLTVTAPDGTRREVTVGERGGAVYDGADKVGLYQAEGQNFSYPFAANLASAGESDILPRTALTITDNQTSAPGKRVPNNRPLLPYLALAALLVLVIEWWAFHRRVYLN